MKKILLIPAIILLVCCVTVGAFNVVTKSDNRPMTFYEALEEISHIEFSLDEMSNILSKISDLWTEEASTYPGPGGRPGQQGGFGSLDDGSNGILEIPSGNFGSLDYEANTDWKWLNSVLNTISKVISTIILIFDLLIFIVKDAVTTVYTLFDVIMRFVVGVPKTTA